MVSDHNEILLKRLDIFAGNFLSWMDSFLRLSESFLCVVHGPLPLMVFPRVRFWVPFFTPFTPPR